MIFDSYIDGVLRERQDSTARTIARWNAAGVSTGTLAMTPAEIADVDARVARVSATTNQATIEVALSDALATLQTIIDTPNNGFTLNQLAAAVRDIARAQRRTIRLVIRRFDGTA